MSTSIGEAGIGVRSDAFTAQDAEGARLGEKDWARASSFDLRLSADSGERFRWYLERSRVNSELNDPTSCDRFPDGFVETCETMSIADGMSVQVISRRVYFSGDQPMVILEGVPVPPGAQIFHVHEARAYPDAGLVSAVSDFVPVTQESGSKPTLPAEDLAALAANPQAWMDEPPKARDGCGNWVMNPQSRVSSCEESAR